MPLEVAVQYLLPTHLISRITHRLVRWEDPPFLEGVIRWFVRRFQVDLGEAADPEIGHYRSFNAFFTRALREGARHWPEAPEVIASPVDGAVSQIGTIEAGRLLQAKGIDYSLEALVGGDRDMVEQFRGGRFATLYLSPRDYHRIHMPLDGTVRRMIHVPGRLFSVSLSAVEHVRGVFARNERVVTLFETPAGPMALIQVGALNVGSIETVWAGEITPPAGSGITVTDYSRQEAPVLKRGEEMGRFNLGSTVILLFGPTVTWDSRWIPELPIRLGERLGTFTTTP